MVFQSQHKGPKNSRHSLLSTHVQATFHQVVGDAQETKQCLSSTTGHPPGLPAAQTTDTQEDANPTFPAPLPSHGEPKHMVQAAPPNPGLHQRLRKAPPPPFIIPIPSRIPTCSPASASEVPGNPLLFPPPKIYPPIPEEREGKKPRNSLTKINTDLSTYGNISNNEQGSQGQMMDGCI